ncbi:MAG: DUF4214 domain-containing protein [Nitrosomonadaceae bacterium]
MQQLYIGYYGRPADPGGLDFWANISNGNRDYLIHAFGVSAEYQNNIGDLSNAESVSNIYQHLFNRLPEQEGLDFYTNMLDTEEATLLDIVLYIINGVQESTLDHSTMNNKLTVAIAVTDLLTELGPEKASEYRFSEIGDQEAIEQYFGAIGSNDHSRTVHLTENALNDLMIDLGVLPKPTPPPPLPIVISHHNIPPQISYVWNSDTGVFTISSVNYVITVVDGDGNTVTVGNPIMSKNDTAISFDFSEAGNDGTITTYEDWTFSYSNDSGYIYSYTYSMIISSEYLTTGSAESEIILLKLDHESKDIYSDGIYYTDPFTALSDIIMLPQRDGTGIWIMTPIGSHVGGNTSTDTYLSLHAYNIPLYFHVTLAEPGGISTVYAYSVADNELIGQITMYYVESIAMSLGSDGSIAIGNSLGNLLETYGGDGFFAYGKGGDDTFRGGNGDSEIDGGTGSNTYDFKYESQQPLVVDLSNVDSQGFVHVSTGSEGQFTEKLIYIQNIAGLDHDDTFTGDANDNIFTGRGGADTLDGGDGTDTANYLGNENTIIEGRVSINLEGSPDGTEWITGQFGHAEGDRLKNIENIIGTQFNDVLIGNDLDNILDGGVRTDSPDSNSLFTTGYDYLDGNNGDDLLIVHQHYFSADGGRGTDTLWLAFQDGLIDFSELDGAYVANIEILLLQTWTNFNYVGENTHTLQLSENDVVSMTDADNILYINGNETDIVEFDSGDGWYLFDASSDYELYASDDNVLVYVASEMDVTVWL